MTRRCAERAKNLEEYQRHGNDIDAALKPKPKVKCPPGGEAPAAHDEGDRDD